MCTVTYVRSGSRTILTSNRDEQALRKAIEPRAYFVNGKNIVFPKDPQAGGTWFAVDEDGTAMVLLNGAAEKHTWSPPYRRSRGLILLDMLSTGSPLLTWDEIDLENIEPFTLILIESGDLYQLRWDGIVRENTTMDADQPHIWSSTPLYTPEVRERREGWFARFMKFHSQAHPKDLYDFHHYTESGDTENGLVINRNNFLKTLSITQAVIEDKQVKMRYHDLTERKEYVHQFSVG